MQPGERQVREQLDWALARIVELEKQVATDHLTGLANLRYLEHRLAQEMERCRRHGSDAALIMLDVDHFKRVNDEHGHDVGNHVLRGIADELRSRLRSCDVAGRWGGEEFLLLLTSETVEGARVLAERLRVAIRARDFGGFRVTASFGVCGYRGDMVEPMDFVRPADEALYDAKQRGRNQVRMAHE